MKKRLYFIASIFIAFLIVPKLAFSQDITGKWAVGYRYNFVEADDNDFKTNGNAHGLNLTYGLHKNIALELESSSFQLKSEAGTKLRVYSLFMNLQLRKEIKNLVPYLVGGAGFQYYDYHSLGIGDREDKDASFAYKVGGGLEYFLTKNLAWHVEASYIYGNTGGDATLDVYSWYYGTGLKVYF